MNRSASSARSHEVQRDLPRQARSARPLRATAAFAGAFLAVVTLLAATLWSSPVASAHAALRSSNPVDGSTVQQLPARAELVFNEDIDPNYAQLVLADAAGTMTRMDDVQVAGPSVSAPLPKQLPGGTTGVRFRVVSADSHPITGQITFTYTGAPAASPSAGGAANAAAAAAQPADGRSNRSSWMMAGLGAAGALVIGVIGTIFVRSDRHRG